MIYNSMLELVGNTPIVKLNKIKEFYNLPANLYVKLEMFNAAGSVKSRIAKAIIVNAINKGIIDGDTTIVEATSGNTGIGLSFVCACLGLKFMAVMPESASIERRKIMAAYGAKVILTPKELGMKGSLEKIEKLKKELDNIYIPSQFENTLNPITHEAFTGVEIHNQMYDNLDILISGIGTGGTITGVSKYLKSKMDIKVIGVEPESSPLLSKGISNSHKIEGIGPNFIPPILDLNYVDEIKTVSNSDAFEGLNILAKKEGIFVGVSSGAAFMVGLEEAKLETNKDKDILVILPDTGERYLSRISDIFE